MPRLRWMSAVSADVRRSTVVRHLYARVRERTLNNLIAAVFRTVAYWLEPIRRWRILDGERGCLRRLRAYRALHRARTGLARLQADSVRARRREAGGAR